MSVPAAALAAPPFVLARRRRLRLARLAGGWRGPALAAAVAGVAALPGVLALPPLDRDEARFAQASAQMLETHDAVNIRFQETPRDKKPVGIHWLQALSVAALSSAEAREIAAFRLPSLLGAMVAAAACVWGARAFLPADAALLAGLMLGVCALLSTEAGIAKTDAALCGAVTVAMAALGRRYAAARGGPAAPRGTRALLWAGLALGVLLKGPVAPLVFGGALLALWAQDRDARWMRDLGWWSGLGLVVLVCGPWAAAVTVATDGAFWTGAVGGDLGDKLRGASEGHGAPPGAHLLLAPLLLFPLGGLVPAAAVAAWRDRTRPGIRFAVAWVAPAWLVFELLPTKLPHYPLPLYAPVAALAAAAVWRGRAEGGWARAAGAALAVVGGVIFAALPLWAARAYGGSTAAALAAALPALAAGAALAGGLLLRRPATGAAAALGLGAAAHMALAGLAAPSLGSLWVSARAAAAVARAGLDPRNGLTPGPVAVAGFAEPSLVFALGTATELAAPVDAAQAIAEGRPALVEASVEAPFRAALAEAGLHARTVARVDGYDYADGRAVRLVLWRADAAEPSGGAPP